MQSNAKAVSDYLKDIDPSKKEAFNQLRETILQHIPAGFEETMAYGMIGYVVPHSLYPAGYHCKPEVPLPFASIAAQKNFIALYHMGVYANKELLDWFTENYQKVTGKNPDMGKSCIRFKKTDSIPFELIGKLMKKMSVKQWITLYEQQLKR
jgi:uncharacterized protein YdhG (YjbR/CyaY superfamily)